jgi:hypothetical protein
VVAGSETAEALLAIGPTSGTRPCRGLSSRLSRSRSQKENGKSRPAEARGSGERRQSSREHLRARSQSPRCQHGLRERTMRSLADSSFGPTVGTGRGSWHLRKLAWLPQRRRARPSAGLDEFVASLLSAGREVVKRELRGLCAVTGDERRAARNQVDTSIRSRALAE